MRGILLAGGLGTRLGELTANGRNKHTLDVGGKPMLAHPLKVLLDNGCEHITVVSSADGLDQIRSVIWSATDDLIRENIANNGKLIYFSFAEQRTPGGIADALKCAEIPGNVDPVLVILGDNVFVPSPILKDGERNERGARCFLYEAKDLSGFGVPEFAWSIDYAGRKTRLSRIARVVEKPVTPPSEFAVCGLYLFGGGVWSALKSLTPGPRGELEITDLLDMYAMANMLNWSLVRGFWGDAGTPEGMAECAGAVKS
jgi:glucose-1-phosphate thymidylyltransferase